MENQTSRRRYNSLRRVSQAQQTRAEIAEAARRLFVSRGWAATTVRDVAREAGVAVPTVYAAYQNKAGLVWALADAADLAAGLPRQIDELEATADPRQHLAAMAGYDRRLFERSGELIALIRDAGRTEPDFADFYLEGRRRAGELRTEVFESWPDGTLRPGLDAPTAVDLYAAVCSLDVFATLRVERSWSPDRIEQWWGEALARELLAPAA